MTYLKLVKAQNIGIACQISRYRCYRVSAAQPELYLRRMDTLVNIDHEGMEVHTTFALHLCR